MNELEKRGLSPSQLEVKAIIDLGNAFDNAVVKVGHAAVASSLLEFDDTPLVCNRDQTGDETCASCQ